MTWDAWFTLGVTLVVLLGLAFTRYRPELILISALVTLFVTGILNAGEALSGLTNQGVVTVAILYIVVAGVRDTGAMGILTSRLLGKPGNLRGAQLRIMAPVTVMSAFMNNTPIVAMFIPAISDWAKKFRLPVSKLMIPMSYAAIFGGICTLIGTSTNLVVNGLLMTYAKNGDHPALAQGLNMFEIAKIGLPCALIGMLYLFFFSEALLPDRQSAMEQFDNPREYSVEMVVEPGSPLVGKSIEEAGLRHLHGMFLMEIEREGELLVAVSPHEHLHASDRLVFIGIVDSVVDLQKVPGLKPATDQIFKLDAPRSRRVLVEAVVSESCPAVGQTIRESAFRTNYRAVIIAVARHGQRINMKIGDIILKPGDTLLLEAHPSFVGQQRHSRDFYLVSKIEDSSPPRYDRAWIALIILVAMVALAALGILSMLKAAMLAGLAMLVTRCCSWSVAKRNVDLQVLLVIVAAFGIGRALDVTGAAPTIAHTFIHLAGDNPWIALAVIYGLTTLFTELITNNAAAVLMFPIAMAVAGQLGVNPLPFVVTIMVGASASFSTPIGYQTNLMVYGPGGYKFTDYLRIGVPLNLLFWIMTVALVPLIWPF